MPLLSRFGAIPGCPAWLSHLADHTYSWSYLKLFALQSAALLAWLVLLARRQGMTSLTSAGFCLPLAAVVAWSGLTATWSEHAWASVPAMVPLASLALAAVAVAGIARDRAVRGRLLAAYGAAAGLACSAYAAIRLVRPDQFFAYPFENPNVAAAFAILPLATGLSLMIWAVRKHVSMLSGVCGAGLVAASAAAIVMSRSAAGSAGAVVAAALVLVFSQPRRLRWAAIAVAVVALAAGAAVLLGPKRAWLEAQLGPRPAIWQGAIACIEHPLIGTGLGSFVVEFQQNFPRSYAAHPQTSEIVQAAHCLPLHMLVEIGLIGLGLAAWLAASALRRAGQLVREPSEADAGPAWRAADTSLLCGAVAGGLGMLAQGLVARATHRPECSVHLVLVLALIGAIRAERRKARHSPRPRQRSALTRGGLAAAALVALFVAFPVRGLRTQALLHEGMTTESPTRREAALRRAVDVGWTDVATLRARVALARHHAKVGEFSTALREARRVDELAPNIGTTRRLIAALLLKMAEADSHREVARLAAATQSLVSYCRKNPYDPHAYILWARIFRVARTQAALARRRATAESKPPTARQLARPDLARQLLDAAERDNVERLPAARARELRRPFEASGGEEPKRFR
jgi:hypothetical protein